jgi:TetR/AcrR family transcriptional regulator, regulator of cefoperazone and chloramphenicol sensitivity
LFVGRGNGGTRERLIRAASELFAERGFHATTAREIAERAGVNLAAANYHYGSKKELYLEVLRAQFETIRDRLARRGASRPAGEIDRLERTELEEMLVRRIAVMLEVLVGPPPSLHGALMQREMADPSQALPMIVRDFIGPMTREMELVIARLAPQLSAREVERCALSVIGQVVFYRFAMPALLQQNGWESYPRGFAEELTRHVTEFSLGGLQRVAERKPTKPGAAS